MKHRSVVIFSIIVMALAVMPEASQRFSELAGNAENRVKTRIWNAFFSLHAQKHEAPAARPASTQRWIPEATELATRRTRPTDTTDRNKIASATQRRNADRLETETARGDENRLIEFNVRAAEAVEVAWLEALPEVERLSKEFARVTHGRELKHVAEQEILIDPDTDLPLPVNSKGEPKIKDVGRVVWRFAEQHARQAGAKRDALIKIRRKASNELKNTNLSVNYAPELPKSSAPAKQVCPSTLANPAPPAEAERTFATTDQAFEMRM